MSLPIVEQLSEDLERSLAEITVLNGYQQDVTIERPGIEGNSPARDNLLIMEVGDEGMMPDSPVNQDDFALPVDLDYYVRVSESGPSTDTRRAILRSDIIKRMQEALDGQELTRSWNLVFQPSERMPQSRAGYAAGTLRFEVHFRTSKFDPYS